MKKNLDKSFGKDEQQWYTRKLELWRLTWSVWVFL